jgi:hypothetical protein
VALWPDTVKIEGATIPLADILSDLIVHHGRSDISDEPTATTCQLTLQGVSEAFTRDFEVGQSLAVTVKDGAGPSIPRFTGRITDARLDRDLLTIIAAGLVSRLRLYVIGEAGTWPVESWSARVTRAFTEAGLVSLLDLDPDPAFDPQLAARDSASAGPTTLGDYLAFLAPMVGALVADRLDGRVLVQAIGARTLDAAYALDPADVAYAPVWEEELPRGNIVTVRYTGDQSESVTVTEPVSVTMYGDRPETIDTAIVSLADATYRANQRLGRSAFAHWNISECPVLRGLDLQIGAPVILEGMPDSAPFEPWTPIVEGWQDELAGDTWRMTLALSDPLLSGVTLPWSAVPVTTDYRWNTVDVATDWTEALTLEDLIAG